MISPSTVGISPAKNGEFNGFEASNIGIQPQLDFFLNLDHWNLGFHMISLQ